MDAKNLSIVFGGVIFGEDEMPKGGDLLSVQCLKVRWLASLLDNWLLCYGLVPWTDFFFFLLV